MISEYILSAKIYVGFHKFDDLKEFLSRGAVDQHPLLTTTYLCGQYAYYSSTSMDSVNIRTFKSELKLLEKVGVKFDYELALNYAVYFKTMLDNENTKLTWY